MSVTRLQQPSRIIITHNRRRYRNDGVLMSVLYHGKDMAICIYVPHMICDQLPKFNDKSRFHIAEGLNDECLYLIPDEDGLTANKSKVGKSIVKLNPAYLDNYKIIWPDKPSTPIMATKVTYEIINKEIKINCPSWLKKVR